MSRQISCPEPENRFWFRAISEHIYTSSGIMLHGENRSIYLRRVLESANELHIKSLADYYLQLRFHVHAKKYTQQLIERITTGETYFFRESGQLDFFLKRILLPAIQEKKSSSIDPIRIWSAGCSTGEEPYTLSMMLLDHSIAQRDVSILGGDINNHALNIARDGIYRESAFRVITPESRLIHFSEQPDGRFRIKERARETVEFTWMNLMDRKALAVLPSPDFVFCRNVMIYFDRKTKQRAISNLHHCLNPGGVLLLGHAESLLNLENDFMPEQVHGDLLYRKAL